MNTATAPEEEPKKNKRPDQLEQFKGSADGIRSDGAFISLSSNELQESFERSKSFLDLQQLEIKRELIRENRTTLRLRVRVAGFIMGLLFIQNFGIWWIIRQALDLGSLNDLQPIFSILIAGTLAQSYFILRKITEAIFMPMNHGDGAGGQTNSKASK